MLLNSKLKLIVHTYYYNNLLPFKFLSPLFGDCWRLQDNGNPGQVSCSGQVGQDSVYHPLFLGSCCGRGEREGGLIPPCLMVIIALKEKLTATCQKPPATEHGCRIERYRLFLRKSLAMLQRVFCFSSFEIKIVRNIGTKGLFNVLIVEI